jgi:hypothetical protein
MQTIDGDNAGCGVIYIGKYYVLSYRPIKITETCDCTGTELFIKRTQDGFPWYIRTWLPSTYVYSSTRWFDINKGSFEDRLKNSVKNQIAFVEEIDNEIDERIARVAKEKSDKEEAIRKHAETIRSKQIAIDSAIKSICPKAKSMIEIQNHERLLAAKSEKDESVSRPDTTALKWSEVSSGTWPPVPKYVTHEEEIYPNVGRWANDAILNHKFDRNKQPVDKYIDTMRSPIEIVDVEVVGPDDPRYLTEMEKMQQAK